MQLTSTVIGVEKANDGVIIVIQQDKQKLPIAEEPECDEERMAKKMFRSLRNMGLPVELMRGEERGFRTGFWVPTEEYDQMGKPTVGDVLRFSIEKLEEPKQFIGKHQAKVKM